MRISCGVIGQDVVYWTMFGYNISAFGRLPLQRIQIMKRKTAVILSFVSIFMCVLASCVIRDRSEDSAPKPGEFTVTFYQDQQVLSQEKVTEGGHAVNIPQGMSWRNETGSVVDPATIAATRKPRQTKSRHI